VLQASAQAPCEGEEKLLEWERAFFDWAYLEREGYSRLIKQGESGHGNVFYGLIFEEGDPVAIENWTFREFTNWSNAPQLVIKERGRATLQSYEQLKRNVQDLISRQLVRIRRLADQKKSKRKYTFPKPALNFFIVKDKSRRDSKVLRQIQDDFFSSPGDEIDTFSSLKGCFIVRSRKGDEVGSTAIHLAAANSDERDVSCVAAGIMMHYGFSNPYEIFRSGSLVTIIDGKPVLRFGYVGHRLMMYGGLDVKQGLPAGITRCDAVRIYAARKK
jgi:hypothetical protein